MYISTQINFLVPQISHLLSYFLTTFIDPISYILPIFSYTYYIVSTLYCTCLCKYENHHQNCCPPKAIHMYNQTYCTHEHEGGRYYLAHLLSQWSTLHLRMHICTLVHTTHLFVQMCSLSSAPVQSTWWYTCTRKVRYYLVHRHSHWSTVHLPMQ